ncbi:sensor histidine kinase [Clostridium polynesiense]|uniref:sensor histidine kinase n=1 Tax=Clostridium polynesiense TaxID=1325933 RepID=UPI00058C2E09|nr:HAMP domain-containing sensor histidine kinase [Clostridium polynesiense]
MSKNRKEQKNKKLEDMEFLKYIIKKGKDFLKEIYKRYLTKLRFSIVLKLNLMYSLRFLSIMFSVNIAILIVYGYMSFNRIENTMNQSFKEIEAVKVTESYIPNEKLNMISSVSGLNLRIYNSEGVKIFNSMDFDQNGNDYSPKVIARFNENRSLENDEIPFSVNNLVSFQKINDGVMKLNYAYEKTIYTSEGDIDVKLAFPLYGEIRNLVKIFIILLVAELLSILLSLEASAKRSRRILRPIDEMISTVKNITINKIDTRLNTGGTQDELKDLAMTFNDMLNRLQRAYEVQNQFVSDASHELRTPIAVIQGYANMLQRWGKEDEKVLEESIEAIKTESDNMKDLVEKLLFLARGDKNTQSINMNEFPLNELIEEVLKDTRLIDENHEIQCFRNKKINLYADPKLIKQCLRIFIDNSIKYTPDGGVISISSYEEGGEAVLAIKDTGIGIDEKDLPNIFNRFYRADKSRAKQTGGTGLGLSIAKWIVMKHKGSIQVDSALNKGTKVIIRLPIIKISGKENSSKR